GSGYSCSVVMPQYGSSATCFKSCTDDSQCPTGEHCAYREDKVTCGSPSAPYNESPVLTDFGVSLLQWPKGLQANLGTALGAWGGVEIHAVCGGFFDGDTLPHTMSLAGDNYPPVIFHEQGHLMVLYNAFSSNPAPFEWFNAFSPQYQGQHYQCPTVCN